MDLSTTGVLFPVNLFATATLSAKANVVFGNPKNKCLGTGICGVYTTQSVELLTDKCAFTKAHIYNQNENTLSFHFAKKDMCEKCIEKHFGKGIFTLSEEASIDEEILSKLRVSRSRLMPGKYQVLEYRGQLIIDFKIF